jgi:TPR repeat protein
MALSKILSGFRPAKSQDAARKQAMREFARGDNAAAVATLLSIGGDADADVLFQIGECYETSKGVIPNFATAASWYEKAAVKGNLAAQARLGDMYLFGRRAHSSSEGGDNETGSSRLMPKGVSVPQDFAKALYWNTAAAEAGSADAQGRLAYQYAMGHGVEVDYALAERWFTAAAEQGGCSGQFGLGMLYAGAYVGTIDYTKAAYWFEKAVADHDDIPSKYYLGLMLRDGLGVPADQERAMALLTEAAEANHTDAMFRLGELYQNALGDDTRFALAETWLRRAGARKHVGALVALAKLLVEDTAMPDYASAAIVLREAAELGDGLAPFYLGQFYSAGLGVPQDTGEAAVWFRKAADQGVIGAMESLGVMHVTGVGQERDYQAALSLFSRAAEQGSASADFNIGNLYKSGLGVERDDEAAIASFRRAAERGSMEACLHLGIHYATAEGPEQDYAAAAEWYAEAERRGSVDGASNLAFLYIRGLGVELDPERGIRKLEALAEAGNLSSVWSLYHLHSSGAYVPTNATEAKRWLMRAADMGSGAAAREFAREMEYDIPGAQPVERIVAWLTLAAEKGEALAQEVLGRWCYEGKFVQRNEAAALHWNVMAAERGNPFAQAWMGDVLNQGIGVIVDRDQARRWYEKAAEQRHLGALIMLTSIMSREKPTEDQLSRLFSLWLNIAQVGDETAQLRVADYYLQGIGVERSVTEAIKWLRTAAERGSAVAQVELGGLILQLDEVGGEPAEAVALFQQAAARGNIEGEYNLGVCYRRGLGVPADRDRARQLYFGAAVKGNNLAQLALADLLVEIGDSEALKEAIRWYEEASAAGLPGAFHGLARLYEDGTGVYPNREKAIFLNRRAAEAGHQGASDALRRLTGVQSAA